MNSPLIDSHGSVDVCIIHVEQDSGEVTVHGRPNKILPTDVKRSDVIKNVCSAGGGVVPLPISYDQFQSWLEFAGNGKPSMQELQPSHLTNILLAADALADAETINEVCTVLRPELMKALGMLDGMEAPQPHQLPPTPRILHPSQRPRSKGLLQPILCCIAPRPPPALTPPMNGGKGNPLGALATPRDGSGDGSNRPPFHISRATALQTMLDLPPGLATLLFRSSGTAALTAPDSDAPPQPAPTVTAAATGLPPTAIAEPHFQNIHRLPARLVPIAVRAFAPTIDQHRSLCLRLQSPAAAAVATATVPTLTHLTALSLHFALSPPQACRDLLRSACALPKLRSLEISTATAAESAVLAALAESIATAAHLTRLALLNAATSSATDAVAAAAGLPGLCRLELHHSRDGHRKLPCAAAAALLDAAAAAPALASVSFGSSNCNGSGCLQLVNSVLAPPVAMHAGQGSSRRPALPEVYLQVQDDTHGLRCCMASELARQAARCERVTGLQFDCRFQPAAVVKACKLLTAMPRLRRLEVVAGNVYEASGAKLAHCLQRMHRLTHLSLSAHIDSGAVISALVSALPCLATLRELHLWFAQFPVKAPWGEVAVAMAGSIAALTTLTCLSLSDCRMPAGDVGAFAACWKSLPAIRELRLARNMFGADRVSAKLGQLGFCSALEVLDLQDNGLRPTAMQALCPVLWRLKRLRHLELSMNMLEAPGACMLAVALRQEVPGAAAAGLAADGAGGKFAPCGPAGLQFLGLGYCGIQPEGLEALAPVLLRLGALKELNVAGVCGGATVGICECLQACNPGLFIRY
eukprot:jgi/Ulvmu1/1748/UM117_0025.1